MTAERSSATAASPDVSRPAFAFILATAFIDNLGFTMTMPVMPLLIQQVTGSSIADAAVVGGWLLCAFAALQFLATPVLGRLSDAYGRRPVLLLSLLALGADFLVLTLSDDIVWLFAARILSGLFCATVPTVYACIADLTAPDQRARRFGQLGAVVSVSMLLGPAIGGWLAQSDVRLPFLLAAGLAAANVVFGLLVLPESLPAGMRRAFDRKAPHLLRDVAALLRDRSAAGLLFAILMFGAAYQAVPALWAYFTAERFHWTTLQVGWSIGGAALGMLVVQGVLIGRVNKALGERGTALVGLALLAAAFVGFAFAPTGWFLYLMLVPYAFGSLAMPALRSALTMRVGPTHQGQVQGVASSVASLAAIVAPLVMTQLFAQFSSPAALVYFPGAPYLLGALLLLAACAAAAWALREPSHLTLSDRHA